MKKNYNDQGNINNIFPHPLKNRKNINTPDIIAGFRFYVVALVMMFAMNSQKAQAQYYVNLYEFGTFGTYNDHYGTSPSFPIYVCEGGSVNIDSFFEVQVIAGYATADSPFMVIWSV